MTCERCGGDSGPYRKHADPFECVGRLQSEIELISSPTESVGAVLAELRGEKATLVAEVERLRLMVESDNQRANAAEDALARARAEVEQLKRYDVRGMCVVEAATLSRSIADYVEHWEGRTLKAEAEVERLKAENAAAMQSVMAVGSNIKRLTDQMSRDRVERDALRAVLVGLLSMNPIEAIERNDSCRDFWYCPYCCREVIHDGDTPPSDFPHSETCPYGVGLRLCREHGVTLEVEAVELIERRADSARIAGRAYVPVEMWRTELARADRAEAVIAGLRAERKA